MFEQALRLELKISSSSKQPNPVVPTRRRHENFLGSFEMSFVH